jgi:hypothetical protein
MDPQLEKKGKKEKGKRRKEKEKKGEKKEREIEKKRRNRKRNEGEQLQMRDHHYCGIATYKYIAPLVCLARRTVL